jgi:hypothetical protein
MDQMKKPSSLQLFQYALGELDESQKHEIEKALNQSPVLKQTLEELQNPKVDANFQNFLKRLKTVDPTYGQKQSVEVNGIKERFYELLRYFTSRKAPILAYCLAGILLVIGFVVWITPNSTAPAAQLYAVKGENFQAMINGIPLSTKDSIPVKSGDTLHFMFRGGNHKFIQVWYQDDGAKPQPYIAPSQALPFSSQWKNFSQYIILESGPWQHEKVLALLSQVSISSKTAEEIMVGNSPPINCATYFYNLKKTE